MEVPPGPNGDEVDDDLDHEGSDDADEVERYGLQAYHIGTYSVLGSAAAACHERTNTYGYTLVHSVSGTRG